jgi:hypothetical protein
VRRRTTSTQQRSCRQTAPLRSANGNGPPDCATGPLGTLRWVISGIIGAVQAGSGANRADQPAPRVPRVDSDTP